MHPKHSIALILAGIGIAGVAAWPSEATARSDKTQGMALMSAVVEADGTLISGSGVTGVTHTGTGGYLVHFKRSVVGCAPVSGPLTNYYDNFVVTTLTPTPTDDTFQVLTGEINGSGKDTRFSLIVFCGE